MKFEIYFPESTHAKPITGRLFLIITRNGDGEPRTQLFDVPLFATDVTQLPPGVSVVIDATTPGYPVENFTAIPPGDYYIQALLNVYTEFHRADGHTVWAHMDQWEGQHFEQSPGNRISPVLKVRLGPGTVTHLGLTRIIPPVEVPPDTKWVRHVKIQSALL